MRSHSAATSMVSSTKPRSMNESSDGTLLRSASQCCTGASPTALAAVAGARGVAGLRLRRRERRRPLGDHEQEAAVVVLPLAEVAAALHRVVEPQHRRPPAGAHDVPDGFQAGVEVGKGEGEQLAALRQSGRPSP